MSRMASLKLGWMWLALWALGFSGCGIYSFTGGAVKEGIKTVNVELFENNSSIVVPTLAQDLTEKLKDKFIGQSNLTLVTFDGDMEFSGSISGYSVAPVAIQGDDVAAANRLTVTVTVAFENKKYPEDSWNKTFSQFSDFSSNVNLSDVETELLTDIVDRLTNDIFNQSLGSW